MRKYKILPAQIKRGSYQYHLIERIGLIGLYRQRVIKNPKNISGYVVARIRKEKSKKLPNGVILPHREKFPSPSEFGKWGFFYMKRSKLLAFAHFDELIEKHSDTIPPRKLLNQESEGITHFEDENDLSRGDGIVA
jgi:hypothetical protein